MEERSLPKGWEWIPLGAETVSSIIMGQSPPGTTYNNGKEGLPFFQGKADFRDTYPTVRTWCTQPLKISQVGDVLISVRAPVGPTNLAPEKCAIGRGLAALRPTERVETKYLLYAVRSVERSIVAQGTGSTFQAISKLSLSSIGIPMPYPGDPARSLEAQRRIVARIEALFAELWAARELHQRVVEDTGRLMEAFIREVFDRPNPQWKEHLLSEVAHIQTGTAKGRRFRSRKTVELPYLRVANVQAGYLDLTEVKTITIAEDEVDRYRLQVGDLLLTEGGDFDKLGRGAVWQGQVDLCVHQNHIFAVRFNQESILPWFAEYEMQSRYAKEYFLGVAKRTTNLATINKTQLSAFPIRYPSHQEQERIVAYLDTASSEVAEMKRTQNDDTAMLAQMEQAILAQAFQGGL